MRRMTVKPLRAWLDRRHPRVARAGRRALKLARRR